jgi:hypothetical protein
MKVTPLYSSKAADKKDKEIHDSLSAAGMWTGYFQNGRRYWEANLLVVHTMVYPKVYV